MRKVFGGTSLVAWVFVSSKSDFFFMCFGNFLHFVKLLAVVLIDKSPNSN